MSKQFKPQTHAKGYARRDFRKSAWQKEFDPETGEMRSVRRPKSYWAQPEDAIPLENLPEFWEHNNTQFTSDWVVDFNKRLCQEYLNIICTYDYETSGDPTDFQRIVDEKEKFFDAVAVIDGWPYWNYTRQKSFQPEKNLVTDSFREYCPDYEAYQAYRHPKSRKSDRVLGNDYARWRQDCLWRSKHTKARLVQPEFQYRDEELQLGEIEMRSNMSSSDFDQISIYQYLDKTALVPTPGMPDLDIIRREISEKTGVEIEPDKFVKIVAEHAERQAAIQAAPETKPAGTRVKTKRELAMDDLNRLVADMNKSGSRTTERSDGSYGW